MLLLVLLPAAALAQELTEVQALQILRESSRVRERRGRLTSTHANTAPQAAYTGPSVNASFEGAGRTEFFFVEQTFSLGRQDAVAKRQAELATDSERARADFDVGRMQSRMLVEFYRLVHSQERRRVILDGISQQERLGEIVKALEEAGEASQRDAFMTEQNLAELRISLSETEILAAKSRGALADLLGGRVSAEALRAKGTLTLAQDLVPLHQALEMAQANRADLQSAITALESSRLRASSANRDWRPSVTLQGGIKRADVGDRLAIGPYVAVSMPVPLPRGRPPRASSASVAEGLIRERVSVLRNRVVAEVQVARETYRIRRIAAVSYRGSVLRTARELKESALARHSRGESNALGALESLRAALGAELRSLELQAAAKVAEIEFRQVLGKIAP